MLVASEYQGHGSWFAGVKHVVDGEVNYRILQLTQRTRYALKYFSHRSYLMLRRGRFELG